jgi:Mrp family chromosome partitioning ATPase
VVRERALLIVGVTLAFAGVAVYFDSRTHTVYDVTATIAVEAGSAEAPLLYNVRYKPKSNPEAEGERLNSVILPRSLGRAARTLARENPGITLQGQPIALPGKPGLVRVGLRHPRPAEAAVAAQAIAEAVVEEVRAEERRGIDEVIASQRSRVHKLAKRPDTDVLAGFERTSAEEQGAILQVLRKSAVGARIVSPAEPSGPAAFTRWERVPPMIVLGLCMALVAAFLVDAFDRSPRDPRRLASAAGLPLAAQVPRLRRRGRGAAAAFHRLRTAIDSGADGAPRLVMISSARSGDGKTTVAVGLAEAAAGAGLRACVVEADLNRPALAGRLGIAGPGLAEALRGEAAHDAVLHECSAGPEAPTVTVMPAGRARPGEEGLLRSGDWAELADRLRSSYHLVVVEAPPVPLAAEALVLASAADQVVLSARAGRTPAHELKAVRDMLGGVGVERPVLVVCGGPREAVSGRESRAGRRRRRRWAAAVPSLREGG